MSLAQLLGPTPAWLAGLAGLLLLAGCAYQDGYYYDPSPGYAYDYGYGGYGYGYGGYYYGGSPCWPYGCRDWKHRHRHHRDWDDDDDDDGGKHRSHDGMQGNRPRFDPNRQAGDFPRRQEQQNPRQAEPSAPARVRPQGPAQPYYYLPRQRDSKN
jgi:hypothetical protein